MLVPRSSRPLLVIARRRGGALAAIVRPGTRTRAAHVSAAVRVEAATPSEAVAAVAAKLRSQGARLPARAIVISPDVETRLIDLPADPARPPAPAELGEMVRWEIEPYLAAQHTGDPVLTGCVPGAARAGPPWNWQVAGARQAALREWGGALAACGSRLAFAYPLAGCAAGAVPPDAPGRFVVEERIDTAVVRTVVEDGLVVSRSTRTDDVVVGDAPVLAAGDGVFTGAASLEPFLAVGEGVEVSAAELAPLAGAARHAARAVPQGLCVCVDPSPPRRFPPLVSAACGLVVAVCVVVASEDVIARRRQALTGLQSIANDARVAQADLAALERDRAELEKRVAAAVPCRGAGTARAGALLDAIASRMRTGMRVDRAHFDRVDGVSIEGRGTDPSEAVALRSAFAADMTAAGLCALDATVEPVPGVERSSTFRFRFRPRPVEAAR